MVHLSKSDFCFCADVVAMVLKGRKSLPEGTIRYFKSTGRKHIKTGNKWPFYSGDKKAVNEPEGVVTGKRPEKKKKEKPPYVPKTEGVFKYRSFDDVAAASQEIDRKIALLASSGLEADEITAKTNDLWEENDALPATKRQYIFSVYDALKENKEVPDSATKGYPLLEKARKDMALMREIRYDLGPLVIKDSEDAYSSEEDVIYRVGSKDLSDVKAGVHMYSAMAYRSMMSDNIYSFGPNGAGVKGVELVKFYSTLSKKSQKDFIVSVATLYKGRHEFSVFGDKEIVDINMSSKSDIAHLDEEGHRVVVRDSVFDSYAVSRVLRVVVPHSTPEVLRDVKRALEDAGEWEEKPSDHVKGGEPFSFGVSFVRQFNEAMHFHPDPAFRKEWRKPQKGKQEGGHTDWQFVDLEDIEDYEEWSRRAIMAWGQASESVDNASFVGSAGLTGKNNEAGYLWVNTGKFPRPFREPSKRTVAFSARLYEETQAFYKKKRNRKTVSVFRGVQDGTMADRSVLESWTSLKKVANAFAQAGLSGNNQAVLSANISPSDILMSYESHALDWTTKYLHEKEYTLLGGAVGILVVSSNWRSSV